MSINIAILDNYISICIIFTLKALCEAKSLGWQLDIIVSPLANPLCEKKIVENYLFYINVAYN